MSLCLCSCHGCENTGGLTQCAGCPHTHDTHAHPGNLTWDDICSRPHPLALLHVRQSWFPVPVTWVLLCGPPVPPCPHSPVWSSLQAVLGPLFPVCGCGEQPGDLSRKPRVPSLSSSSRHLQAAFPDAQWQEALGVAGKSPGPSGGWPDRKLLGKGTDWSWVWWDGAGPGDGASESVCPPLPRGHPGWPPPCHPVGSR